MCVCVGVCVCVCVCVYIYMLYVSGAPSDRFFRAILNRGEDHQMEMPTFS